MRKTPTDTSLFPSLKARFPTKKCFFRGKEVLVWSINNYIGLSNEPEVREADKKAAEDWGLGYPMGSRMMSGNTNYHEELEGKLSTFTQRRLHTVKLWLSRNGFFS